MDILLSVHTQTQAHTNTQHTHDMFTHTHAHILIIHIHNSRHKTRHTTDRRGEMCSLLFLLPFEYSLRSPLLLLPCYTFSLNLLCLKREGGGRKTWKNVMILGQEYLRVNCLNWRENPPVELLCNVLLGMQSEDVLEMCLGGMVCVCLQINVCVLVLVCVCARRCDEYTCILI